MTGELLRILWALAVVVVFIVVVAKLLGKKAPVAGGGLVQNLGYMSLGPRRGIVILKVAREVLLVGLTQTEIKLLKAYPEEEFLQSHSGTGNNNQLSNNVEYLKSLKRLLQQGRLYNEKTSD